MVNSNGNLVVIGGKSANDYQSSLHVLSCYNGYCQWQELQQKLQTARAWFVAMTVPDDFVDCCDLSLDASCGKTCNEDDEIRCKSSYRCIKKTSLCDGIKDCADYSDETDLLCSEDDICECENGQGTVRLKYLFDLRWELQRNVALIV